MSNLEDISFKLGEIKGQLNQMEKKQDALGSEIISVSKRVKSIEIKGAYDRGSGAGSKKIIVLICTVAGGAGGVIAWAMKSLPALSDLLQRSPL